MIERFLGERERQRNFRIVVKLTLLLRIHSLSINKKGKNYAEKKKEKHVHKAWWRRVEGSVKFTKLACRPRNRSGSFDPISWQTHLKGDLCMNNIGFQLLTLFSITCTCPDLTFIPPRGWYSDSDLLLSYIYVQLSVRITWPNSLSLSAGLSDQDFVRVGVLCHRSVQFCALSLCLSAFSAVLWCCAVAQVL